MVSKLEQFKGLMAPAFVPYKEDNQVNCELIEPYAKHLKSSGISAVLVNGTAGEGMFLTVDERMKVAEKWSEACKKFDILLMLQISGCPFVDVVTLAKHAESLKVDGVLCLPELYFKPKSVEKLVIFIKDISCHCPTTPIYYYHIPMFTQIDLPMAQFMQSAKQEIKTFAGIKYTSGDLEKGLGCLEHGQVFLGSNTILCGALALGFTSAIMITLNIVPEMGLKIIEHMNKGEVEEARNQQKILSQFVASSLNDGNGELVPSMKKTFNDKFKNLCMGKARKPF